jgi:hypothetical protein
MEINKVVQKSNTDPKPHICYLNTDSTTMCELFLNKIKPMEGIVKYKMVGWNEFPTNTESAKLMGKYWVEKFHLTNLYNGFSIGIYFHLEKKTIRFELKSKNSNSVNLINLCLDDVVEEKILSNEYVSNSSVIFDCGETNYFDSQDLVQCKNTGKRLSEELEAKYTTNKFVVFLNPTKKTIQITLK